MPFSRSPFPSVDFIPFSSLLIHQCLPFLSLLFPCCLFRDSSGSSSPSSLISHCLFLFLSYSLLYIHLFLPIFFPPPFPLNYSVLPFFIFFFSPYLTIPLYLPFLCRFLVFVFIVRILIMESHCVLLVEFISITVIIMNNAHTYKFIYMGAFLLIHTRVNRHITFLQTHAPTLTHSKYLHK